ncbi:MAG TPA: hypothetical protein PLQ68_04590 [Clostridia bacterium]|mgnify:CR=1 FL=1|nr:hypothetical protein [Clostridia bacterium]
MAKKIVNIDEFLDENSIEFTLNGKKYLVKDVDVSFEAMDMENTDKREILANVLQCDVKELEKVGLLAITKVLSVITENFSQGVSQVQLSPESNEQGPSHTS